ncbi:HdeA/HdeB family chaperone [Catenovulum sp. 2E275]|uniref:HdeA/HdeB family chaperone n=1 Tax=Catenovulum sp. 2E275 TaxID=2980497 RepID=UPI0021CFB982|nr:HdeA/HdeB family chaperone [Catenovulum sp. 2E275]MCU4674848.1 HdeA/HdeB family chaperone [Catenovulum sp. 2E275]
MKYSKFLFCLLLGCSFNLCAIDKNGKYAVKGVGNLPCSQFVEITENNQSEKYLFAGWLNGYITGHNQYLAETFDIVSWENIETLGNYLLSHCRKNPSISFYQATTQMLSSLYDVRIIEFIGAEHKESNGQGLQVYTQTIRRVQKSLKAQGLYQGEVNGKVSDGLIDALNKFKQQANVNSTDDFSQQVLFKLLKSQ